MMATLVVVKRRGNLFLWHKDDLILRRHQVDVLHDKDPLLVLCVSTTELFVWLTILIILF